MSFNNITRIFVLLTLALTGCSSDFFLRSPSEYPDGAFTFTQEYGQGGTRLPKKPASMFYEGYSIRSDVVDLYGEPQIVGKFDWGIVLTYRYWENKVGHQRYEENVDFVFDRDGFLSETLRYNNYNSKRQPDHAEFEKMRDEQCPSQYKLCQSYKPLVH